MRLEHYRKLYEQDARKLLSHMDKEDLITLIIDRFSINDWKDHYNGTHMKKEGESS